MEDLKKQIEADMVAAMRAKQKERVGTIRMLMAMIKQREIDDQITLDNTSVIKIIEKMIKQRRESIIHYQAGKRPELAVKEQQQIDVLQAYMPEQMSEVDITVAIDQAICRAGASTMKDMGKVMGILKDKLQGRADMGAVSAKIKQRLGG